MGEVVFGIIGSEKAGVAVLVFHAQRLIRGDVDTGIFGVVGAVGLAKHLSSVGAKNILKGFEGLSAQLVTVAYKQSASELAGIRDALEQVYRDEGLAGTCSQRECGKSLIRGMRIAVEHVLGMLAGGDTPERLLREYPFLEPADIQACLTYAHRSLAGEQVQDRITGAKGIVKFLLDVCVSSHTLIKMGLHSTHQL